MPLQRKTDQFKNQGLQIEIYHVPSDSAVTFKSYLTQYADNYEPKWNEEDVYGRNDPLLTFENTKRSLDIGWQVVANDKVEAFHNMAKLEHFIQMLYPSYTTGDKRSLVATSLSAAPIVRIRFLNLIMNAESGEGPAPAKSSGLLGRIGSFSFAPELEEGFFINDGTVGLREGNGQASETELTEVGVQDLVNYKGDTYQNSAQPQYQNARPNQREERRVAGAGNQQDGIISEIFPQSFEMSFDFVPNHTHELGWDGREPREDKFPYGISLFSQGRTKKNKNRQSTTNEEVNKAKAGQALSGNDSDTSEGGPDRTREIPEGPGTPGATGAPATDIPFNF